MNPNEFDWTDDQQVTVTNPTGEAYEFTGFNKAYRVEAGQTVKLSGYPAMLYVYHLSQLMAQQDDKFSSFIDPEFRKTYYKKLIVGFDGYMEIVSDAVDPSTEANTTEEAKAKRGRPAAV